MRGWTTVRGALLGVSLIGIVASVPAVAQDAAGASSGGDIIVTARRTEERLQDVPISITVFNQAQLESHNVIAGEDLARTTPSLQVNNNFGTDNTMFSIRGFSQDIGSAPTVGTYFADVVAPRGGSFSTPAGEGAGPGAFFDLQNVQVLKGPQGTLQGRNTTGGAVMLVPQRPTDRLEGYVEGTVGNFSALGIQGVINIPVNDTFKVRLGVDRQKRDGYVINHSGIGPRDFGNINYTALRASVLADLTPNLENYMIVSYSDSNTHGSVQKEIAVENGGGSLAGFALDQLQRQAPYGFYGTLTDMPIAQTRTRQWQIINTTSWQASDNLKIKNIISYAEYRQQLQQPEFGTNFVVNNANGYNNLLSFLRNTYGVAGLPDPATLPNNGSLLATLQGLANTPGLGFNYAQINPLPGYDNSAEATFTEELQLQGKAFDGRLNWQGGFYFERATPLGASGVRTTVESQCQNINVAVGGDPNCFSALAVAASAYYQALLQNGYTPAQLGSILPIGGYNPSSYTNTLQDTALYLQATYKLTDTLSLTGGFRYTWDKISNADDPRFVGFQINPLTGALSGQTYCANTGIAMPAGGDCFRAASAKSSAPTWLIDVDWKPVNNVLVYAKWSRGYRSGGEKPDAASYVYGPLFLLGAGTLPQAQTYELDVWKPEKVDAYEVGLKSSFHGVISGTFNIAGFYNRFSNQQVLLGLSSLTAPLPGQSSIYNAGKSRIYGVEVDTSLNLFKGFELNVGYTYLNTKAQQVSIVPGGYAIVAGADAFPTATSPLTIVSPSAAAGLPLSYSPKNKVVINGNYTLPLDEHVGEITIGATFTHTDSQYGTFNDIGIPSTVVNGAGQLVPTTTNLGLLQATNLLDLNFSWKGVLGSPLDLSAFATNVTGEKYYTGVPGLLGLGVEVASVGAPRMVGGRVKVHF